MDIGARLKALREANGLTQEDVGNSIGVTKATINRYESGEIDIKRTIAIKLAKVFNTTPAYIMGWDVDPNKPNGFIASSRGLALSFILNEKNITLKDLSAKTKIPYERLKKIKLDGRDITQNEINLISNAIGEPSHLLQQSFIPSDMTDQYIQKLGRKLNSNDYLILNLSSKLNAEGINNLINYLKYLNEQANFTIQSPSKTLGEDIAEEMSKNGKGAHISTK